MNELTSILKENADSLLAAKSEEELREKLASLGIELRETQSAQTMTTLSDEALDSVAGGISDLAALAAGFRFLRNLLSADGKGAGKSSLLYQGRESSLDSLEWLKEKLPASGSDR